MQSKLQLTIWDCLKTFINDIYKSIKHHRSLSKLLIIQNTWQSINPIEVTLACFNISAVLNIESGWSGGAELPQCYDISQ